MRARWIAVARPRNWRAVLVSAVSLVGIALLALLALLVDLPAWTLGGLWIDPMWSRLGLLCIGYLIARTWLPLSLAFLSSAPLLWGSWVRVLARGRSFRIPIRDIKAVEIELRPQGEVAVLILRSGVHIDLCPLDWYGAAPLVSAVRIAVLASSRAQGSEDRPVQKRA